MTSGAFLIQLETTYQLISGRKFEYEIISGKPFNITYEYIWEFLKNKTNFSKLENIIFVGDNKLTDIYGANNFKLVCAAKIYPKKVHSILVKTGVDSDNNDPKESNNSSQIPYLRYIYRNFQNNEILLKADHFVEDVYEAVKIFV